MSKHDKHELVGKLPKFREMANSARESAKSATTDKMRREYLALADSWDQLIKEIENS